MSIRYRLIVMNFMQFFVWGAWLISIGKYLGGSLSFNGTQIGSIFSTLGIASIFMPTIMGIIADKWLNAEKLYGFCHLMVAATLLWASTIKNYELFFVVMLINSMFYMPTIALNNTVSYTILERKGFNVLKDFPPIRSFGTIGFIAAMWFVDITGWKETNFQLIFSAASAICLGIYAFTMPACPPSKKQSSSSIINQLGLDAFVLFKDVRMFVFFLFAMFLGAALQITNAFGGTFLGSFSNTYPNSFVVKHEILTLSISQISETLFILSIPFFLKKFGIKKVMLLSMIAWVFRFGLFAIGNPGSGLVFLIASMIIYGMAFDFFNISGSLFVEKESPVKIRASAQGLFMLMTNGLGALIGGYCSGLVVDYYSVYQKINNEIVLTSRNWQNIWIVFAAYALLLALIFPFVFKYKHNPSETDIVHH